MGLVCLCWFVCIRIISVALLSSIVLDLKGAWLATGGNIRQVEGYLSAGRLEAIS